jgi:hypothetical protein
LRKHVKRRNRENQKHQQQKNLTDICGHFPPQGFNYEIAYALNSLANFHQIANITVSDNAIDGIGESAEY